MTLNSKKLNHNFCLTKRLGIMISLSLPGGYEVTGGTDNTMKAKTVKEGPKVRVMGKMEEKHQDQKPRRKNNLNFGTPNTGLTSKRRASIVELKATGEVSIEIVQNPEGQTEMRRNKVVNESESYISTLRQYSKTSSEHSPDDDGSKNHFRKVQNKSTLILFGIVLIFLICNIPRLGVKIFHIYHQGRSVQKHFNACAATGQYHAPIAIVIMGKMIRIEKQKKSCFIIHRNKMESSKIIFY